MTPAELAAWIAGRDAAARAILEPWDDLGDRPSSPPAALLAAEQRVRALQPPEGVAQPQPISTNTHEAEERPGVMPGCESTDSESRPSPSREVREGAGAVEPAPSGAPAQPVAQPVSPAGVVPAALRTGEVIAQLQKLIVEMNDEELRLRDALEWIAAQEETDDGDMDADQLVEVVVQMQKRAYQALIPKGHRPAPAPPAPVSPLGVCDAPDYYDDAPEKP